MVSYSDNKNQSVSSYPRRKNSYETRIKSINDLNVHHMPCPLLIGNIVKKLYFIIEFLFSKVRNTYNSLPR